MSSRSFTWNAGTSSPGYDPAYHGAYNGHGRPSAGIFFGQFGQAPSARKSEQAIASQSQSADAANATTNAVEKPSEIKLPRIRLSKKTTVTAVTGRGKTGTGTGPTAAMQTTMRLTPASRAQAASAGSGGSRHCPITANKSAHPVKADTTGTDAALAGACSNINWAAIASAMVVTLTPYLTQAAVGLAKGVGSLFGQVSQLPGMLANCKCSSPCTCVNPAPPGSQPGSQTGTQPNKGKTPSKITRPPGYGNGNHSGNDNSSDGGDSFVDYPLPYQPPQPTKAQLAHAEFQHARRLSRMDKVRKHLNALRPGTSASDRVNGVGPGAEHESVLSMETVIRHPIDRKVEQQSSEQDRITATATVATSITRAEPHPLDVRHVHLPLEPANPSTSYLPGQSTDQTAGFEFEERPQTASNSSGISPRTATKQHARQLSGSDSVQGAESNPGRIKRMRRSSVVSMPRPFDSKANRAKLKRKA